MNAGRELGDNSSQNDYENTVESPLNIDGQLEAIQANIHEAVRVAHDDNEQRYLLAKAALERSLDPRKGHDTPYTTQDAQVLQRELSKDGHSIEERLPFHGGEIVRVTPEITRTDDGTGEPIIPLVFVRGMGANEALPWYVKEVARMDQRPVIAVMYHGRLEGHGGAVKATELEGVAEIDVRQSQDLLDALDRLGIPQVDLIAESRGGIRGLLAMLKEPQRFRHAVLKDIPLDERTYLQRHTDALREKVGRARRGQTIKLPAGLSPDDKDRSLDKGINARKEQNSVARARLGRLLAKLSPNIQATVTYDEFDEAFAADRAEKVASSLADKHNLHFARTKRGGHGFMYDPDAVAEAVGYLRSMEKQT